MPKCRLDGLAILFVLARRPHDAPSNCTTRPRKSTQPPLPRARNLRHREARRIVLWARAIPPCLFESRVFDGSSCNPRLATPGWPNCGSQCVEAFRSAKLRHRSALLQRDISFLPAWFCTVPSRNSASLPLDRAALPLAKLRDLCSAHWSTRNAPTCAIGCMLHMRVACPSPFQTRICRTVARSVRTAGIGQVGVVRKQVRRTRTIAGCICGTRSASACRQDCAAHFADPR